MRFKYKFILPISSITVAIFFILNKRMKIFYYFCQIDYCYEYFKKKNNNSFTSCTN